MLLAIGAVVLGLLLLVWSADRFVESSAGIALYAGIPPLLIGMVVIGFGTSAPEMLVSAISAMHGKPGLALGNAYGSNIANIALILGVTALIRPINVSSKILAQQLPILFILTLFSGFLLWDLSISRNDASILLTVFGLLLAWTILEGLRRRSDSLDAQMESKLRAGGISMKSSIFWLFAGLVLLVLSSHVLVWGAVEIAQRIGVSDLVIGLTIVAMGTSLPELASSLVAVYRKEHDIAIGNVIGSNLFNTLAVVGIAGIIHPIQIKLEILYRDFSFMTFLTFSLFAVGYGFGGQGRINRFEGGILLASYAAYTALLIATSRGAG